ncbi:putative ascorbate-specific transmembrane electron transporter 1 [Vitis vinifera]|uniref:ascorbate ferrireductase (transmembrane) n=1 Tax=Vitis vinifera TaxID=29760 RepID=A0A438DGJ6_VITVI|nr:putative ascorbate-specific transmembrane electron transporter 1 [Vitis vinifera]
MAAKGSSFQITATPVTLFAHLLLIAVTTLVLVWLLHFQGGLAFKSGDNDKIFNLHPFLMIVGFIMIAGEAIMSYKTVPGTKRTQKLVHLILHFIALGAGIFGVYIAFRYHDKESIPDMYTLHSWLGLSTICLFGLQWVFAFFSFWFPGAEMPTRGRLMPWHWFAGMVIFLMAILTAETGLVQRFKDLELKPGQEALVVNFTGLLILLFAIAVSLSVILPRGY